MDMIVTEVGMNSGGDQSSFVEKKKTVQPLQGISLKKRRRIDSKTDLDAANYLAETYFNRAKTSLSEEGFEKFVKVLCDYNTKSCQDEADLYRQLCKVFEGEKVLSLADDFLSFIRPQFAKEIGRYEESSALRKAWSLFNSLDSYHFNKMLSVLEWFSTETNLKTSDIESSLKPLFKGQPSLVPTLCQLFPSAKPHLGDINDYEKVLDIGSEKDTEFEHVYVPRGPADRSCPGQSGCQCGCHSFTPKPLCSACNIRFINGRIYVQRGKEFRTAKVSFGYGVSTEVMQRRLHPSYYAQLQALAQSQPKTSPAKGEKKDRKNSQSEPSSSKSQQEVKIESGPECVHTISNHKADSKSSAANKGGGKGLSGPSINFQEVFYAEHDEGYLEFFMEESEPDCPDKPQDLMDTAALSHLSDCDIQATSGDEISSPSRRSPARCNGAPSSSKKSKTSSKRSKR